MLDDTSDNISSNTRHSFYARQGQELNHLRGFTDIGSDSAMNFWKYGSFTNVLSHNMSAPRIERVHYSYIVSLLQETKQSPSIHAWSYYGLYQSDWRSRHRIDSLDLGEAMCDRFDEFQVGFCVSRVDEGIHGDDCSRRARGSD
jgi:hypothetical protein